jgi:Kef-type K+ transport system membrane component KefB
VNGEAHLEALLVLVLVTVIGPIVAVRLRLPTAIVLIVAGIAIGPSGLDLVRDTPAVAQLSELGFLILMFAAGLEIDFETLRRAGARALLSPVVSVVVFFAIASVVVVWADLSALELLVVSASSVGMPLAVLQEAGQLQRPLGRYVMATASLGEFVSILGITGYEVLHEGGSGLDRGYRLGKVLLLFVASAALIRWARASVWWRPHPFRRLIGHHDAAELGVRTGLCIMFAFVVLAARLGVEAILGAFIAGALVAFVFREKGALEAKVGALGHGLFIPLFFVVVGVRFELRLLDGTAVRDAAALVLAVALIKILPSLLFAPRELGLRPRLAAGALLGAPLTLVVAIAAIGRRLGAVTPERESTFVLLAILLSVVFPVLFRMLAGGLETTSRAPAEERS